MPCWKESEFLAVGKHLQQFLPMDMKKLYTPELISERYDQFGGIFRHVLPESSAYLKSIVSEQSTRLIDASPMDVFAPRRDIEKHEQSKNISHYLLQYNVSYGGNATGKPDEFTSFSMIPASYRVKEVLHKTIENFYEADRDLHKMFVKPDMEWVGVGGCALKMIASWLLSDWIRFVTQPPPFPSEFDSKR